jgi:hypothetical protein
MTRSSDFALTRSFLRQHLAEPPQRSAPLMGFGSLQHMQALRVYHPRAVRARFVPPSGFDYPLGGLFPATPGRFYFAPAALMGFGLRSVLHSQGIHGVSAGKIPRTVQPDVTQTACAEGRPVGPRFLGFGPCESPLTPLRRLSCKQRRLLPWPFSFQGMLGTTTWPGSHQASSHALATPQPKLRSAASRSVDRRGPRLDPNGKPPGSKQPS